MKYEECDDPFGRLCPDLTRRLNWRPWLRMDDAEQARMRCVLIEDLRVIDAIPASEARFWWRQTHRELLELKVASARHHAAT